MSLDEYVFTINDRGDRLRVERETAGKAVLRYVVQYEALLDGRFRAVVRHDNRHGRAHRHLLDWNGDTIAKDFVAEHVSFGDAHTAAIEDLATNWATYLDDFLRRRP